MTAHIEPIASLALWLVVILVTARLGAEASVRLGQPAVLGELAAGIVLGNLRWAGIEFLEPIKHAPSIDMLASLGVLILLFEVGLESTVTQMMKVGFSAVLVAVIGVVTPFALGWLVTAWLLPDATIYAQIFLAATLTATSIGITARVLKDLGHSASADHPWRRRHRRCAWSDYSCDGGWTYQSFIEFRIVLLSRFGGDCC